MSIRVTVASTNPVKIEAVRRGFSRVYSADHIEVAGISAASGVADQPVGDHETLTGALNRVNQVKQSQPQADFWAGIEGGIDHSDGGMTAFAWVVVESRVLTGRARTAAFYLPEAVVDLVNQGIELGEADDLVFKRRNSKTGNGAIGILTNDLIDRTELYAPAVVMALIPFMQPDLYPSK